MRNQPDGKLRRFIPPNPLRHYIIGVDASAGDEDSNLAAIQVVEIESHAQAAEAAGIFQPDALARNVQHVAEMYSGAVVAIEREKYGVLVISKLMDRCNLYFHQMKSTGWKPKIETEYGWNPRYREEAVRRLRIDFSYNLSSEKERALIVNGRATLLEMSKFVRKNRDQSTSRVVRYEASYGHTDDLVSALYIANYVWHEIHEFYVEEKPEIKDERPWCEKQFDELEPKEAGIWD